MRFISRIGVTTGFCFGLLILAGATLAPPVQARTFRVPEGFSTIQEAIDLSEDGDTVLVAAGVYYGPGNRNLRLSGTAINLLSEEGPLRTRLDCEDDGFGLLITSGDGSEAVVDGFSIDSADDGGILCIASNPVIKNCRILRCRPSGIVLNAASPLISACAVLGNESAGSGAGIYCYSGSFPEIVGCVISGNRAAGNGGGIYCSTSSPSIFETTIAGNHATEGGGISCRSNSNPIFMQTILRDNCAATGPEAHGGFACSMVFTCCAIDGSGIVGVKILDGRQVTTDPLFCTPVDCSQAPTITGDYRLSGDSPCLVEASPCRMRIGGADQGCPGTPTATISWGEVKLLFGD